MKTTIVIPTYNEKEALPSLVHRLVVSPNVEEVIVVDDNSPDGTAEAVRGVSAVRVLERRGKRLGLGSAVRFGAQHSHGDHILVMDGDGQHSPEDGLRLVSELSPETDLLIGSRFFEHYSQQGLSRKRKLLSKTLVGFAHYWEATRKTTDPLAGLFLTKRNYILSTKTKGFKILLEILLRNPKLRVRDIPIQLGSRTHGTSKANFQELVELAKTLVFPPSDQPLPLP